MQGSIDEVLQNIIGFYSGVFASLLETMHRDGTIDGREFARTLRIGAGNENMQELAGVLANAIERRVNEHENGGGFSLKPVE